MKTDIYDDLSDLEESIGHHKQKKFSWFRAISTTGLIFLIILFFLYSFSIIFTDNNIDKNNKYYKDCLEKIGLSAPTWETYVSSVMKEVDIPKDKIWNTFSYLEGWKDWAKPLVEDSQWIESQEFKAGNKFTQKLNLGFPAGTITSIETIDEAVNGEKVVWKKDENGTKSCHVWAFEKINDNKTLIIDTEIFHGFNIALAKPFVTKNWQDLFEKTVEGLVEKSK